MSSCKPDGPHYKLYNETKEWGDFKENTWWLYENETTGEQDCLWVEKNDPGVWQDYADKKIKESGDYIWLYIENTDTNRTVFMSISANKFYNIFYLRENDVYKNNINEYTATILAFDTLMLDTSYYTTKTFIINKYDTYTINNKEYNNVINVTCEILDYYDNSYPLNDQGYNAVNEYWIAKYEGIIKKILRNPYDTCVWILQDCDIVKD